MRDLLAELGRWRSAGEAIALATLVRVHRTAPRLPGARMAVTASGRIAGSVSGGCVEGDVAERARAVLASGRPALARYDIADELGLAVGLSCGGAIDVLIEPFAADAAWDALRAALDERRPAALCTALAPAALLGRRLAIVGADRDTSAPGTAGPNRTADRPDALRVVGSIDPTLDGELAARATPLAGRGGTTELTIDGAPGAATVLVEGFPPAARLAIVGATHTAIALARLATEVGYHVIVVDPRGAFTTPERFPGVEIVAAWPAEALAAIGLDAWTSVVTLTHDPKFDVPALAAALRSPAPYVGALGSRRTHAGRQERLRAEGFGADDLARIHAPIGLDLGGRAPAEIALAILAEMQAVRHGRAAGMLRARSTPIHAPA